MPAARYWRLVSMEAHGGADLELSALHLYDAAGRADAAASLSSTIAPTAGTLAALQDEDLVTTCRFAAADLRAGGFAIVWDFGADNTADILGPRLAGPALATFLSSCTLQRSDDGLLWKWVAGFGRFDWPGAVAYTNAPMQGDPHFEQVALLLQCSGAHGSTTFTDSSSTPKTVTAYGVAKISTAYSQFPDGALELSGLDSGLNLGELLSPGTPYCMEAFVRLNASDAGGQNTHSIFSQSGNLGDGDQYFGIEFESRPNPLKLHFYRGASIAGGRKEAYGSVPVARETRVHVALSFDGSKIRGFLEGQLQFEVSDTQGWADTGMPLRVGQNIVPIYSQYRLGFQGCIAGVRLTVGNPRYTSNFTPPTLPFAVGDVGAVAAPPLLRAPMPERARIAASAPVPPHSTLSAARLLTARDMEFAGSGTASATGTIYGSTAIKGSPNAPVRAKVSLLRARDLLLVQQTWSDPTTGAYAFHGLDPAEKYTTLAEYPTGDYRAVAADQLTPDIEEARAP